MPATNRHYTRAVSHQGYCWCKTSNSITFQRKVLNLKTGHYIYITFELQFPLSRKGFVTFEHSFPLSATMLEWVSLHDPSTTVYNALVQKQTKMCTSEAVWSRCGLIDDWDTPLVHSSILTDVTGLDILCP